MRQTQQRNSRIELLRLLGMVLIVCNHVLQLDKMPDAPLGARIIINTICNFGGAGDWLFFGISAWFLCQEESPSLRRNLRRCWIFERQLLYYSLTLLLITYTAWRLGLGLHDEAFDHDYWLALGIRCATPTLALLWWYPTAYILFLCLCVSLTRLLRALGEPLHRSVCVIVVFQYMLIKDSRSWGYWVLLFVLQYVLISYFVWYKRQWVNDRCLTRALFLFGLALGIASSALDVISNGDPYNYLNNPTKLPSAAMAMGLIFYQASAKPRYSRVLNKLSGCVLGAYLVMCFPPIEARTLVTATSYCARTQPDPYLYILDRFAIVIGVFVVGCLYDLLRQGIFAITFDRHKGRLFDRLWVRATSCLNQPTSAS